MVELRRLRYFLAVAETRNFTRAAERCFVAQSALSAQIARLEAELGTPLFVRSSRSVRLTTAGEALQPLATRILAEVDHAVDHMHALAGRQKGRLRLGIIQTGASAIDIIDLVACYHRQYPGIELDVIKTASADMAAAVTSGKLDVAIVALPKSDLPDTLTYYPIVDDPLVAVLSRHAAVDLHGPVALRDVVDRGSFIHYLPGSGLRRSVNAAFDRAGLTVETGFELSSISDMIRLAALGVGVTVVPRTSAEPVAGEVRHTVDFALFELTDPAAVHPIGLVHEAGRLSPAATAFVSLIISPTPTY